MIESLFNGLEKLPEAFAAFGEAFCNRVIAPLYPFLVILLFFTLFAAAAFFLLVIFG